MVMLAILRYRTQNHANIQIIHLRVNRASPDKIPTDTKLIRLSKQPAIKIIFCNIQAA